MKTMKKILREIGVILFFAVGTTAYLGIATAAFWWNLPDPLVARIALSVILAFTVIYTAASLNSEYRLVVRVERRQK